MELHYAPHAKSSRRSFVVVAAGTTTSALALGIVWSLTIFADFNIMGRYLNKLLPWGAIVIGLVASSGYGLASWLTGVKIRKQLLIAIAALSVGSYFAAQYVEYLVLVHANPGLKLMGFWDYFHFTAVSFAWIGKDGNPAEPLGLWGYCFRGLELIGFVAGTLAAPTILRKQPYCELCQQYMGTRSLLTLPAAVPTRDIAQTSASYPAYATEQADALRWAEETLEALRQHLRCNDTAGFKHKVKELAVGSAAAAKRERRLVVNLVRCRNCNNGYLQPRVDWGSGTDLKSTALSTTEVPREQMLAITSAE